MKRRGWAGRGEESVEPTGLADGGGLAKRSERPNPDEKRAVLDLLDGTWMQHSQRIAALGNAEHLWEPAPGCWSVRPGEMGRATVDGAGERDKDPAPVTTIAWRLWHIGVDCCDSYSERLFGGTGASVAGDTWHLDAASSVADAERAWFHFRGGLEGLTLDQWWEPLGDEWGPFSEHTVLDLSLHAAHELIHHTAEIALLRDLFRAQN